MFSNQMNRRRFLNSVAVAGVSLSAPSLALAKPFMFNPTPREVRTNGGYQLGRVLVVPGSYYLYLITEERKARRYGVGVGKAGRDFTGSAVIKVKKKWPSWRPTDAMIGREPHNYTKFVDNDYVEPGGLWNPLGARALYLFQNGVDTYFRIHGTTRPDTIGQSVSNGCIRMLNDHVIDLYQRVPLGTVVTVL